MAALPGRSLERADDANGCWVTDATCYERFVTYPTDAKLIWKCCNEVYVLLNNARKQLKLRRSQANHDKWRSQYLVFAKSRKKSRRKSKKLCKSLLKYLHRLFRELDKLRPDMKLSKGGVGRLKTIETLKEQ